MNWKRLNYTEPAVLRGILMSAVALLGSVGVTVSADLTTAANSVIISVTTLLPLLQALWTRKSVSSPQTVDDIKDDHLRRFGVIPQTPDVGDHRAE